MTLGRCQFRQKSDLTGDKMRLPIGYDDFGKIVDNKLEFVDKSLFIKDFIDDTAEVVLITRPRRFGKTSNMSLLHYFFAEQVLGRKTQELFGTLKIAQESEHMAHQGKYPVVSLTLKDVKSNDYEGLYESMIEAISTLYQEHRLVLEGGKLYKEEEKQYEAILSKTANRAQVQKSLQSLTQYLYRHYGKKSIVLIDEYDTPIQAAYVGNHYNKAVDLIRGFLSPALKNNAYLQKAALTGILRVAKESLFSGLNNLKVYSLLDSRYSEYFGFTEEEVKRLFVEAGLEEKLEEARSWYNGYQMGNKLIYNPWSIVNCIQERGILKPYWINTSDNLLAKRLLIGSSVSSKEKFQKLLQGGDVNAAIDDNFVFTELQNNESALWSLFLMSGYLKATSQQLTPEGLRLCKLEIPNLEVKGLYARFIKEWLANGRGIQWYNEFLERLLAGDVNAFEEDIQQIMLQTASVHDVAREPEAFYQGLLIGLTTTLSKGEYIIKSNRESGLGRYDIAIIPKDPQKMAIIIELKSIALPKIKKGEEGAKIMEKALLEAAKSALLQINSLCYIADLGQLGIANTCKIGLAFSGKHLKISYELANLSPVPRVP